MCKYVWIDESDPSVGDYHSGYYAIDCGGEVYGDEVEYVENWKFCPYCGEEIEAMTEDEDKEAAYADYCDSLRDAMIEERMAE